MFKINIKVIPVIIVIVATSCSISRKVSYEFPAAMAEPIRIEYRKQCDKGQILYKINCSGCHNVKVRGGDVIPDFKQEQLIGYELRVSNQKHESNIPETNVSAEELGLIMTFLNYKNKTGIQAKGISH